MFAGKTKTWMSIVRRARQEGRAIAAFKHRRDTRFAAAPTTVVAHDGESFDGVIACENLLQEANAAMRGKSVHIVAIDEAQWFPDILEFVRQQANYGRYVVVAGLAQTAEDASFGRMGDVVLEAEEVLKLQGKCEFCGQPGSKSWLRPKLPESKQHTDASESESNLPALELRRSGGGGGSDAVASSDSNMIRVGGAEMYACLCRKCFYKQQ